MTTAFDNAPPAVTVGGLLCVPIDIRRITAALVFDAATSTASADASFDFQMGKTAGHPIFDLRQTPTAAWLDGASFATAGLALRDFGGGTGAELRVIPASLAASSTHTLRLTYALGTPIGSPTSIQWSSGQRLVFRFGFTDLSPARYLEQWLPSNLLFDSFEIEIDLRVTGTSVAHTPITNGAIVTLAPNHFRITFPATSTAFSPMLELRPTDSIQQLSSTFSLPVSGASVTVEAYKLASSAISLTTEVANIQTWLAENETEMGPYVHGNRFVAFLNSGGMEYDGATTSGAGPGSPLRHEVYHSFWGRGVKPAGQPHGWWDEAWNVYHDDGAAGSLPFDFSEPAATLCSQNPFSRVTSSDAYGAGSRFFEGVAAETSAATLRALMREFYEAHLDAPTTTMALEEHLVARSGEPLLVDAFHRFVYGLGEPSPRPDLWLRDDTSHTGADEYGGRFWDSPDLWVRNADDGGTAHQSPVFGRDNWIHARVRNLPTAGVAPHFVVVFNVKQYAGTEFSYPADFLPGFAASAGFDLGPGQSVVLKARWPADRVPAAGTHACLLASIVARSDHPAPGRHVWQHNNLAQKNLTIVSLPPRGFVIIPFKMANLDPLSPARFTLELLRPKGFEKLAASLVMPSLPPGPPATAIEAAKARRADGDRHECGLLRREARDATATWSSLGALTTAALRLDENRGLLLPSGARGAVAMRLAAREQRVFGLRIEVPERAKVGSEILLDLVKRDGSRRVRGGIAVRIQVAKPVTKKRRGAPAA